MRKSLLLLVCFGWLISLAIAEAIPYPVDSPEYQSYKESLIGKEIKQSPVITGIPQSIHYERSSRNGLLIPLDDTFILALAGNDDGYTSAIQLPFTFDFYGSPQTHFYINNNGNVSFGGGYYTYTATGFPVNGYPMLAPFWADVDTRPTQSGKVHYRMEDHRVVVTWPNVGYFSNGMDKTNTFQLIFTDGTDPLIGIGNNVAFSYGDMQWTTGSASGGSGGFGGTPATVGINKGDGIDYALIGRFDHEGTDYYGALGAPSGVSFLDNQLFIFSSQQLVLPPFFTGIPAQTTLINRAETRNFQITANSSSYNRTVDANVFHDFEAGFDFEVISGNPCYINISITGSLQNIGEHQIMIEAFDDDETPLYADASFIVNIINQPAQPGDYLLIANHDNPALHVLDLNTDELYGPYLQGQLGEYDLLDVVISHRGDFALVSNFDNNTVYHIGLANPYSPVILGSFNVGFRAEDITLSLDDRFALVADGGTAQYLAVIDLQSRAIVQTINISPRYAQGIEIGPDGKVLVNDYSQGWVHQYLLDLETGVLSYSGVSIYIPEPLNSVISPDGKYAIACSNSSGSLLLALNDDNSITVLQNLNLSSQSAVYSVDQQMALIYSFGAGQDTIMAFTVNEDGSMELQNNIPLPRYSAGGYYGVDILAISRDKNWAFASDPSENNYPLIKVNLATGDITSYPVYNAAGIALGSMGLSAFFNAQIFPSTDGFQVDFVNLSFGNPSSWLWEFGDGTTSTQWNPSHIYQQPGLYNVSLTIYKGEQSHTYTTMLQLSVDEVYYLNAASSPYYFTEDLVIPEGVTLIVEPGTTVNFAPNAGLTIFGHFEAENAIFGGDALLGWKGIFIDSREDDIAMLNIQIKNAKTALKAQNSSFLITNLQISKTQDFPLEKGVHLIGACNMTVNGLQITGYRPGIVMNNQSRVASSPLMSNIRIRNSGSTSREENQGMVVTGAIALNLEDVEIDDYASAFIYDTAGYNLGRAAALLSNIRIRNSGSTSRTTQPAISLIGANSIDLSDVEIEDYTHAIEMLNTEDNRATASPLLSNIRIRNSGSTSREASVGISSIGNISPRVEDSEIEEYETGILINSEIPDRATNNALLSNIRIRNSGSTSRNGFTGVMLQDLASATCSKLTVFYQPADSTRNSNNLAGSAVLINGGNATVSRSTIWGLEHGLKVQGAATANLTNSIIWTATGAPLTQPILVESGNANVNNSNISYSGAPVYPGANNMAMDPCFVDPEAGDYELRPRSPLRDLGIGAEDFDYEAYVSSYSMDFAPGWNMLGVPLLAPAGEDTPLAFFGEALNPFYVHPYYTSILQMNPFSITAPGILSFQGSDGYSVPASLYPGPGYWIRNPNDYPITVHLDAVLDTEDYEMKVPGVSGAYDGFYMLANPYDVDISIANQGIDLDPTLFSGLIRLYDPYTNSISALDLFNNPDTVIPAFAAFIVKSDYPNASIFFKYPTVPRNETPRFERKPQQLAEVPHRNPQWEMHLQAVAGDNVATATLGISKTASDAYDPMDVPDLPFELSPAPLKLRAYNPDWESLDLYYLRDIRSSEAESWTWPLRLEIGSLANGGSFSGVINIGLKPGQKLPGGFSFHLINPLSSEMINLAERSYTLSLNLDENDPSFSSWESPLILEVRKLYSEPESPILTLKNYPNPFNPSTTISFSLPSAGKVEVELYNIKGQRVRRLLNADKAAGVHSVVWDGKDDKGLATASGLYYCKVKTAAGSQILKLMMLK